jgi:hypothetical protein
MQMDLNSLRPGHWLLLREDLTNFMILSDSMLIINKLDPWWETTPPDVIAAVQTHTREFVLSWVTMHTEQREDYRADRQTSPDKPDTTTVQTGRGIQGEIRLEYQIITERGPDGVARTMLHYHGAPQAAFLYAVQLHLKDAPPDAVRRCPECATLFVRVRKQVYCSRACLNRSGVRRWRSTAAGKQDDKTRSRARYEQKTTEKTSPHARVGRHRDKTGT